MCFFLSADLMLERYTELCGERQQMHRVNTFVCFKIIQASAACCEADLTIAVGLHFNQRGGVIPPFVVLVNSLIVVAYKNATIRCFSYLPVEFSGIIDITISHGDTPLTRIIKDTCLQC